MNPRTLILAALVLPLSACVSVLPKPGPAPDIYQLHAFAAPASIAGKDRQSILLPVVQAPRTLKNNRVALVKPDGTFAYANSARWVGATPEMLQSLIASAMNAESSHVAVYPGEGVDTRYELHVRVRNFEAVYDQGLQSAPQARVNLRASLVDRKTRSLVAQEEFAKTGRADSTKLGDIAAEIDQQARKAAEEVAIWLTEKSD